TIAYASPEGKQYKLNEKTATLIVRPRGWHLDEKHLLLSGKPIPGALADFGIYFYLNAKKLLAKHTGPYFYLPKLESYEEAQLWADIFTFSEKALGLKHGTIKATVLIETIVAAFEMDEILYALRDYCVGLNCGRWDYIFSFIKKFNRRRDFVLPDRAQITMTTHFLRSYSLLLIHTCHRRGAFAMGGMSAYIPVKNDEEANAKAFAMVRTDKEREANDGHDGTWVAHPGLVPVAMAVFDQLMKDKNQLSRPLSQVEMTAKDLLTIPKGDITEAGLRNNISVSVQYLANWLSGNGCVPIFNLMEDAATAEIARSQIWQWIHHPGGVLKDDRKVTLDLYKALLAEELKKIHAQHGDTLPYGRAAKLLTDLVSPAQFTEFLTLPGYAQLA
ncbi:MAG: malate synthase, partial [Pseudomonadota bacterium]|nr:malate synthase [Pseudomonadota bacterium]